MPLVDYPDSSDDEGEQPETPPVNKRKLSSHTAADLPPLPASFLDQYSSTVRTSTQDDPSLHGGRKRVTPHVEGNWPTHVFLEWHPDGSEHALLSSVISSLSSNKDKDNSTNPGSPLSSGHTAQIHSLLQNELSVSQPLHVSLSRPLVLKTDQRDRFLSRLRQQLEASNIKSFVVQPQDLVWHPNETKTRWFLVLRLRSPPNGELRRLLVLSNDVAKAYGQPELYAESKEDSFHISIAWSLEPPSRGLEDAEGVETGRRQSLAEEKGIPDELLNKLYAEQIRFSEVKVRIGQDVHNVTLKTRRESTSKPPL